MGLFDRFRKVAEVTDTEALSAAAESDEAELAPPNDKPANQTPTTGAG